MRTFILAFPLLLVACPAPKDDTAGTNDTDSGTTPDDSTPTDDSGTTPDVATATFVFDDLLYAEPVVGAVLTSGAETATTDDGGVAALVVPASGNFWVDVAQSDYPDHHFDLYGNPDGFDLSFSLISKVAVNAVGAMFGVTPDPAKGMLVVLVNTPDGTGGVTPTYGTTVDLDAAYDIAVTQESAGYGNDNVIPEGGGSAIVFGNVVTGAVTVTLTPPGGMACVNVSDLSAYDGGTEVWAGEVSVVYYLCM